jgi:hypothetical protein
VAVERGERLLVERVADLVADAHRVSGRGIAHRVLMVLLTHQVRG